MQFVNPATFLKKVRKKFGGFKKKQYLCTRKRKDCDQRHGALAQLVEHRTENPCVPGSIPGGTTPPFISPVFPCGAGFSFVFSQIYVPIFAYLQKIAYLCTTLL